MKLQNLHTHCTYCDGKNTMSEIINTAIKKGFSSIGFSSHSHMPYAASGMKTEDKPLYLAEIKSLKEKYKGTIDIYAGIEYELYSVDDLKGYDYTIGSCHFFERNGEMVNFDCSCKDLQSTIDKYFSGDAMAMVKEYYKTLAMLPDAHNFDIVGHCDIVTKNNEKTHMFDEDNKEYLTYALEAIIAVCEKIKIFEINTGAIARGYRTRPYPSKKILKEIRAHGGCVTISSDCHRMEFLDANFNDGYELAKECGFKEIMIFDGKKFVPERL